MDEMSKEKKARNVFNEALPQVFNREGLVKKNPDAPRATQREFSRIISKALTIKELVLNDPDEKTVVSIILDCGVMSFNHEFSTILCTERDNEEQPDIILSLILNGWSIQIEMMSND